MDQGIPNGTLRVIDGRDLVFHITRARVAMPAGTMPRPPGHTWHPGVANAGYDPPRQRP